MTPLVLALCFAAAPPQAFDPAQVPEFATAYDVFTELADWNRDGIVTEQEATELIVWVGPLSEWLNEFTTELVFQGLNRDELKAWTLKDISGSFEALDANGDGLIEPTEVTTERLTNGEIGTRGVICRLAHELLLEEADKDGDQRVTAEERAKLVALLGMKLSVADVTQWIERCKTREASDRNRMAPGVAFLTLETEIDLNRDELIDVKEYRTWFKGRDTNNDGALSMAERNPPQAQMDVEFWREPADERWALPCLMPWQRNLKDALAVQKRTGQNLLICVNMDGETACDALANWRYREAPFAELAAGYVCLVVSPDDHQPREYDDRGRRMVSPRLGRVTDREHIDMEPELFARYFEGRRVAPRHVGVAPDGTVLFDVYLINDPVQLDNQLREHARPVEAPDWSAMGASELSVYPDASAREEMERRMLAGDIMARVAAAAFVDSMPDAGMIGLRDPDAVVRAATMRALSASPELLDPLQAQRLKTAISLSGTGTAPAGSALGTARDWKAAASLATLNSVPAMGRDAALAALERLDEAVAPDAATPTQALLRAGALLQLAQSFAEAGEDPRDAAAEAAVFASKAAGVNPWRASAIEAVASGLAGNYDTTVRASRSALTRLWMAPSDPLTLHTLRALRTGATQLVYGQLNDQKAVDQSLVADGMLAGRTLLAHPAGTEADAVMLLDLAGAAVGARSESRLLLEAVTRFPASAVLHQRLRAQQLRDVGAASMGARYDSLDDSLQDAAYRPTVTWFRGLALLVAAEWEQGQGASAPAFAAYEDCIESFEASIEAEPTFEDSALHYLVLAHAGAASLAVDAGELESAARHLQAAAALRPSSLDLKDGLGLTPRERALAALPVLMPTLDEEHQAAFLRVFPVAE